MQNGCFSSLVQKSHLISSLRHYQGESPDSDSANLTMAVTSMLTTYLTPYATLVHQGKGTEYPR